MANRISRGLSKVWLHKGQVYCTVKGSRQVMKATVSRVDAR